MYIRLLNNTEYRINFDKIEVNEGAITLFSNDICVFCTQVKNLDVMYQE